jgi:hypothetical protein
MMAPAKRGFSKLQLAPGRFPFSLPSSLDLISRALGVPADAGCGHHPTIRIAISSGPDRYDRVRGMA